MISYLEAERIFKLDTKNSSYILGVYEENYLLHLYYGAKIPDCTGLFANAARLCCASFSPRNPHVQDSKFSVDVAPMEYSCNGSGDFRITALTVRNADGDRVTDLRYISHTIHPGKPPLDGLPATYAVTPEDADTLEILTEDPVTGIQAVLSYTVFEDRDVITRNVKILNPSQSAVQLERVFSVSLDLPDMDYDLITLYGRHAKERSMERRPLAHGQQGISSKRGASSHTQNPFAALVRHGADEDQGEVYGFNLVYSGNFSFEAECDFSGTSRVLMGINPTDFCWHLNPGESFQAPEVVLVYTKQGLGEMSRIFHQFYQNHLIRGRWKTEKRPLLINSWEAAYFDFDTDKLVSFAERAKEVGIDMLVMDDGWFGKRNDDTTSLGDWYVNEEKLPGGLGELIRRVNALGLKFGIWYEPEMISPDSELFRAHPDWCVHVNNREPALGRQQYVLDVSRQDVRDNIFNQMYAVLSQYPIDYVKWDFNRNISDAGSAGLPYERKGEFFHRFVLGTYELMDRVMKAFPDLLLENCSGGGGRFDPGMLYYSPQIWASDNTDPIERLTIQYGTSMCYPASAMGAHVSKSPRTGYETKGNVALWGTFGYELDPNELTAQDMEIVKQQVAEYHKYYNLIREGDLYRNISPYDDGFRCAWSFVSADKAESLTTLVTMRQPETRFFLFKFKGLDPMRFYLCDWDHQVYSGAMLMNAGLNLSEAVNQTGDSLKIYLKAVENEKRSCCKYSINL